MWVQFPQKTPLTDLKSDPQHQLGTSIFYFAAIVALHQEN